MVEWINLYIEVTNFEDTEVYIYKISISKVKFSVFFAHFSWRMYIFAKSKPTLCHFMMRGWGGTLHNVKASSMLCSVAG